MPDTNPAPDREALMQGYLDGTLDADGCRQLLELVRQEPELGKQIVSELRLDGMLKEVVREKSAQTLDAPAAPQTARESSAKARAVKQRKRSSSRRGRTVRLRSPAPGYWSVAGLAAGLLVAVIAYFAYVQSAPQKKDVASKPAIPASVPVPVSPAAPREIARVSSAQDADGTKSVVVREENGKSSRRPLVAGLLLLANDRLETAAEGRTQLTYRDENTVLDLGADTVAVLREDDGAKHIAVDRGTVAADVARQPNGKPMIFSTPQADATVLGTRLSIASRADTTSLAVTTGKVQLRRSSDKKAVAVSTGELALANNFEPLVAVPLLPTPTGLRLIEGNEDGLQWSRPAYCDPADFALSTDHAAGGKSALRFSYQLHSKDAGGRGYGMLLHPVALAPTDAYLLCRVYIERADDNAIFNFLANDREGGGWFLGDVRLCRRPPHTWFTFAVPVRTAKKKNNEVGSDHYDPAQIINCGFSIFGGSAVIFVDDLSVSPTDPLQSAGERP